MTSQNDIPPYTQEEIRVVALVDSIKAQFMRHEYRRWLKQRREEDLKEM